MNDIDFVEMPKFLTYVKSKDKQNNGSRIIEYWYHKYIADVIIREHRRTE